jgi:hypothetical protein
MNTVAGTTRERFHFDRGQLATLAENNHETYVAAQPFPHIVLDDILPKEVLGAVLAEFPQPQQVEWMTFDSPLERKLASKDDSTMGEATRHLLAELNSAPFIDFLERLTGIPGLVPDPHFVGGGLHQIERGGHLKVHADFNRHPQTGLERRLNVLLYLNRGWKDEYGGALELWNRDMSAREAAILPLFNRCVVFSTTDTSFHGHPEPLNSPEGETRKSIALYYYSKDRPEQEASREHSTLFQARPGEELAAPEIAPDDANGSRRPGERVKAGMRRVTPPIVLDAVRRLRTPRA